MEIILGLGVSSLPVYQRSEAYACFSTERVDIELPARRIMTPVPGLEELRPSNLVLK